MTLEILICTYGAGIMQTKSVVLAPARGIRWLISWQRDGCDVPIPSELLRQDVTIVTMDGRGLSRNRNNALRHATGDICIIADDDNRYTPQALDEVLQLYRQHPDLDMALCRLVDHEGQPIKDYAATPFPYACRPYGYYVQSQEITFRRTAIRFTFDERFGIGAPLPGGEDELFVHEAWRNGLRVEYHPLTLCATDRWSTGTRIDGDPALLRAKGAVLAVMHGCPGATLRVIKYALSRHVPLKPMLEGVWRSL